MGIYFGGLPPRPLETLITNIDASTGAQTIELPDATTFGLVGAIYRKTDSTDNVVKLKPKAGQTINLKDEYLLEKEAQYVSIASDRQNWWIVGEGGYMKVEVIGRRPTTGVAGRVTVGTTATLIRPANPNRVSLLVTNMSATEKVYLGFEPTVTVETGHPLEPKQSSVYEAGIEGYIGAVYGIAPVAVEVAFSEV